MILACYLTWMAWQTANLAWTPYYDHMTLILRCPAMVTGGSPYQQCKGLR